MSGLLDFLQSASNTAASNVSAPVDGIAWLLRKAGVNVDEPVGGSDWMQRQGLTRPVGQSVASLAGETMGLLAPITALAKAPQIARGLLGMAENATIPSTMARQGERGMALFNTEGLPNRGRELIHSSAEGLADRLKAQGFHVEVQHSGSAAGPSSYLKVFDPQTGRFFDDVRLSNHSKGAFNSAAVKNVATPEEFQAVIDRAIGMRSMGAVDGFNAQSNPSFIDSVASAVRPSVFDAFKQARDSLADFSKYRAK